MSPRIKYSVEEKLKILQDYDNGKSVKIIAAEKEIPVSTVVYFVRNRSRFETKSNASTHIDQSDNKSIAKNEIGRKRTNRNIKKFNQKSNVDKITQNEFKKDHQSHVFGKTPHEMKVQIIDAWNKKEAEERNAKAMEEIAEIFGLSTRFVSRVIADQESKYNSYQHSTHSQTRTKNAIDEESDDEEFTGNHQRINISNLPQQISHCEYVPNYFDQDRYSVEIDDDEIDDNIQDDLNDEEIESDYSQEDEPFLIENSANYVGNFQQRQYPSTDISILDRDLVRTVLNVFDQLKRIKSIADRLPVPEKINALDFSNAMLATANRFVDRLCPNSSSY
ncbi:hypothetical protein SSS_09683 [Sarcoptes scabiei]|uniref:Uncharacterized protein n=1 Tax=Sarcoptes scabiei TaxID=52283 RepID=A0A132ABD6_SARSC|nr:hypothetical protein SSS_09683 [Sarcoptes scabiei]KPM08294.1 hypothetical protein QR98_0068100 [Sarcoptes scabiei]